MIIEPAASVEDEAIWREEQEARQAAIREVLRRSSEDAAIRTQLEAGVL